MEKFAKMALLVDFYGPLLTERQQNIWDLYYQQDLSLTEIAESEHISRQAVHDLIRRTEKILNEYEEKLGLVNRFLLERDKLQEVLELLQGFRQEDFLEPALWTKYKEIMQSVKDILRGVEEA